MPNYSLESVIGNYELLTHEDPSIRETANIFLMKLIDQDGAWKIT
jgi:hypothetical protein